MTKKNSFSTDGDSGRMVTVVDEIRCHYAGLPGAGWDGSKIDYPTKRMN